MDQMADAARAEGNAQRELRPPSRLDAYFATLGSITRATEATTGAGEPLDRDAAFDAFVAQVEDTRARNRKIMFIGNGGSATIASHMAIDYGKNGGFRATSFNDGASLTCLGNDLGYENVFRKQIEMLGDPDDLLVAVSSSGNSPNILLAVEAARAMGCRVVTLSGFKPDNRLRKLGDLNFYVQNTEYGFVEISHLAICHAVLDVTMGWPGEDAPEVSADRDTSS